MLKPFEGWSRSQAKAYKKQLAKEHEREIKARIRKRIADIKAEIKGLKAKRRGAIAKAREECKAASKRLSERIAKRRKAVLERLRKAAAALREAEKGSCSVRKAEAAKEYDDAIRAAEAELREAESDRRFYAEMYANQRRRTRERATRATTKERKEEAFDRLVSDLEALELAHWIPAAKAWWRSPITRKTGRRGNVTITEAFLDYIHDEPEEWLQYADAAAHAYEKQLEREQRELEAEYRRRLRSGDWSGWEHGGIPEPEPERGDAYEDDLPAYEPAPGDPF